MARRSSGEEVADLGERPIDAQGFDDLGLVPPASMRLTSRSGSEAPPMLVIRVICLSESTGMMPGDDGEADPGCAASIIAALDPLGSSGVREQKVGFFHLPVPATVSPYLARDQVLESALGKHHDPGLCGAPVVRGSPPRGDCSRRIPIGCRDGN